MPEQPAVDGILNVNKPEGVTSFDVVRLIRRLSGQRRVGHAGTLDPAASGVLLVGVGQATRVLEFLMGHPKVYHATIKLGSSTDTYDASGEVVASTDPSGITREMVEHACRSFEGDLEQVPPMYSAIKRGGKRLYELARAGIEVEREPRHVQIYRLELVAWNHPSFDLLIECGKGTYIRSLAHDLGEALGCGAHLERLVRERVGRFSLDDSLTTEQLQSAFEGDYWRDMLHPVDEAFTDWKAAIVGEESEKALLDGKALHWQQLTPSGTIASTSFADPAPGERCRAYSLEGTMLALLRYDADSGLWRPEKVFRRR